MRNRRAIAEYLDAPEFRNELQQCSELFATEQKAKKQRQGDLVDGDQTAVVAAEDDEEEDPTPEEEEVQQMNHLLVEDTPTLPFKANTPASKTETMKEKLLQFKKLAVRKVSSTDLLSPILPNAQNSGHSPSGSLLRSTRLASCWWSLRQRTSWSIFGVTAS